MYTHMINTKPFALTRDEIKEIAAMEDIRQMWGAESQKDMEDLLEDSIYAVRYDFVSGGPGYVGDLFILQGDALGEPLSLIRGRDGELKIA